MVHHLIGRKHRQKYMEIKRPDLVNWDRPSDAAKGGRIIRAKAEIIERQDGRGTPKSMPKMEIEGQSTIPRDPPKQRQNRDQRISQKPPREVRPLLPEFKNYQDKFSNERKYPAGKPNAHAFHQDEPNMNRERRHQWEDTLSLNRMEGDLQIAGYRENHMSREDYMDSGHHSQYGENFVEDPLRRAVLEAGDVPRYDYGEEMPRVQAQHVEYYPEEGRDALKKFYPEEGGRGQVCSPEYQPSQLVYPEGDNRRWSRERESGGHDGMNRTGRPGSSELDAERSYLPPPVESDRSHHMFPVIRDYQHKTRELQEIDSAGPGRAGASTSYRQMEVGRTMSDIPEPFKRFLTGGPTDEEHGKRKRKSRFSDATPEEVEMTKEMYTGDYGPPNAKYGGDPRSARVPLRPEISGTQYSDHYRESQNPYYPESYPRGGSESKSGVFDLLKNIEIENAEEADFLKNKLCSLLREFKSKKVEKEAQNSPNQAGISRNYSDSNLEPQLPRHHQYERTIKEDTDHRSPADLYFNEDHRRGSRQREHIPEEQQQEYPHPLLGEPRHPNRSHYEEMFEGTHSSHSDEPSYYPERFQEPVRSLDYQPAFEDFYDPHSSAPPLHMEEEHMMHRGPRYSSSLDKITSTLLELVSRK